MALYLRNKTWWYAFTLKGKLHRGSCKTQDQTEAQEYEDMLRAQAWRGKLLKEKQKHTAVEAIDKYMEQAQYKRSYREDRRHADWWKACFQKASIFLLEDVTPQVVAEIKGEALRQKTRRGNLTTPATVNRKLAFLRTVINMAHSEWMWLEQAPKFRLIPGEKTRRRYLRPDEVIRLVRALPSPYGDMALFSVATGLRQGNVFGMKWTQVDLSRQIVTFPNEVMKNGSALTIPLTETAMSVVRKWVGKHDEYVFVGRRGRANGMPSAIWAKALREAGIEDLRWHDLRHTWASLMRQSGVGLADLQELGGWKTSTMVQRYAHLNVEHLRQKAQTMESAFVVPARDDAQNRHLSLVM
jgi:integrase